MKYKYVQSIKVLLMLCLASPVALYAATVHDHHGGAHHGSEKNPWIVPEEEITRPNPVAATAESVATGSRLFKHFCITCHGYNADDKGLSGQKLNPKPADLTVMAGQHKDGDLAYKIRNGRGPMPQWADNISDTNVWHLVNFIQSLENKSAGNDGKSAVDSGAH